MKNKLDQNIEMLNSLLDQVDLVRTEDVMSIINSATPAAPVGRVHRFATWKIIAAASSFAGIAAATLGLMFLGKSDEPQLSAKSDASPAASSVMPSAPTLHPRTAPSALPRTQRHPEIQIVHNPAGKPYAQSSTFDSSLCETVAQMDYATLKYEYTRLAEKYSHFALFPAESIFDDYSEKVFETEMARKIAFFEQNDYDKSVIRDVKLYACLAQRYSETVAGIYRIELNNKEMANLGIHIAKDSVYCNIEEYISELNYNVCDSKSFAPLLADIGYDTSSLPILQKRKLTFYLNGKSIGKPDNCSCSLSQGSDLLHEQQKVVPCAVADTNGISPVRYDIYYGANSNSGSDFINGELAAPESKLTMSVGDKSTETGTLDYAGNPILGKLIPVDIVFDANHKIHDKSNYRVRKITLWYVPNTKFLSRIPERYRTSLSHELEILKSVENNLVCLEDACHSYSSPDSFFDLCRITSGVLSFVNLYPNPCSDRATITYRTSEPRNLKISVHNQNGALVERIANVMNRDAGTFEYCIDVRNYDSGTYLLAISSDRGEQVVQRLTVVK